MSPNQALWFFVGLLVTLFYILFFTLSLPVYLYRLLISVFAKTRQNLQVFISSHSIMAIRDFYNETQTTSRANIVVPVILQNRLSFKSFRKFVEIRLLTGDNGKKYGQLKQYPVHWAGFYFWQVDPHFSIENHVICKGSFFNEDMLEKEIEHLLNNRLPLNRSPWTISFVECFDENKSAFVFTCHHIFADGVIILGLLECLTDITTVSITTPTSSVLPVPSISRLLRLPLTTVALFGSVVKYALLPSPWKVTDNQKSWWQVTAITKPMGFSTLKKIKQKHGVSIHAILLHCFAVATRELLASQGKEVPPYMTCNCFLPVHAPEYRAARPLTNLVKAAVIKLLLKSCDPIERLQKMQMNLREEIESLTPDILRWYFTLMGYHLGFVAVPILKNVVLSTALSNFAGPRNQVSIMGSPVEDVNFRVGMIEGVLGVGLMALTYNNQFKIATTAEASLMTKQEAKNFVDRVLEEITVLSKLSEKTTHG